jgi:hypothetical protein
MENRRGDASLRRTKLAAARPRETSARPLAGGLQSRLPEFEEWKIVALFTDATLPERQKDKTRRSLSRFFAGNCGKEKSATSRSRALRGWN